LLDGIARALHKVLVVGDVVEGSYKANLVDLIRKQFQVPVQQTIGYSDSRHDIPFLEAVGTAIVVNPDRFLYRYSIKKSWQML